MISLLSYGEVLVDFLPNTTELHSFIPLAGGAPANVAVAFAKLGGDSYFAGGISRDNFGSMLMEQLKNEEVNTLYTRVVDANTAIVIVSIDNTGERSFNFYRQHTADTQYDRSSIDNINWQEIGVFHFCSNTLTDEKMYQNTLYAIKQAEASDTVVSFDVNLRQQLWGDLNMLPSRVETCIKKSDIVKLSKDEASYLANLNKLTIQQYVSQLLSFDVQLVLITDGPNAIQVINSTYSSVYDVPQINPVDTTGAGDSFFAGFLYYLTRLSSSKNISLIQAINEEEATSLSVKFASQCGALTCQKKGAFTALPTISELENI